MAKPETTFIASIHRHLPPTQELHHEKMHNPYSSGTADVWYSGKARDLWVEYKFLTLPKRDTTGISLVSGKDPMLSVLQQDWLKCREAEGRNVMVIVGCKEGGVVMETSKQWEATWTTQEFKTHLQSRQAIAAMLFNYLEKP